MISLLTATYKRPDMLRQCLKKGGLNAGMEFEWLIYDNAKQKNIGLNAYAELAKKAKGEYLVTIDEDVIKFPKNWLLKLFTAYTKIVPPGHKTWGWLGCDTFKDEKTNGALWPDWINDTRLLTGNNKDGQHSFYIDKQIPQTCAIVSREIYDKVGGFPTDENKVFPIDARFGRKIDKIGAAQGIYLNVKVYHASGPYFYKKYPKLWQEKQGQTIKQSSKVYFKRDPSLTVYENFSSNASF